jgi:hypothetical protein
MSLGISTADLLSESLSNRAFFNKHSVIGDTVTGDVIDYEVRQSRDFDDNKLEFWDDGSPRLQLVINLQTDLREEPNEDGSDDEGIRSLYVKWWGTDRKNFLTAIKQAGVGDLAEGGKLTASYIGDGEQPDKKKSAPKIRTYGYNAPGAVAQAEAAGKK